MEEAFLLDGKRVEITGQAFHFLQSPRIFFPVSVEATLQSGRSSLWWQRAKGEEPGQEDR